MPRPLLDRKFDAIYAEYEKLRNNPGSIQSYLLNTKPDDILLQDFVTNRSTDEVLEAFEGASQVIDVIYDELYALEVEVVKLELENVVEVPDRVFKYPKANKEDDEYCTAREKDEEFVELVKQMPNSGVGSKREKLVEVAEEVKMLRGVLGSVKGRVEKGREEKAKQENDGGKKEGGR